MSSCLPVAGLKASGIALLLACGLGPASAEDAPAPIVVTITDKGCEPASLAVVPGKSLFKIKNASAR